MDSDFWTQFETFERSVSSNRIAFPQVSPRSSSSSCVLIQCHQIYLRVFAIVIMSSVTEPAKSSPPSQPNYPAAYPTFPGAYPPGPFPPPFYTYAPPPPDGSGENAGHAAPYMMPYPPPPGMVYAYPPPPQGALPSSCVGWDSNPRDDGMLMATCGAGFYQGETNGKQNKRKQVKMAVSPPAPYLVTR